MHHQSVCETLNHRALLKREEKQGEKERKNGESKIERGGKRKQDREENSGLRMKKVEETQMSLVL